MTNTKVDTSKLKTALEAARQKLADTNKLLESYLTLLGEKERSEIPKVRVGFSEPARYLANVMAPHKELIAASGYDASEVLEDLANLDMLKTLIPDIDLLKQRINDTLLVWSAEAYLPTMSLYSLAKIRAKNNPDLQEKLAPMIEFMSTKRLAKKEET